MEAGEGGSTAAPFPCTPTLAQRAADFEKTRFFLTHVDQSWKMKLLSVTARSPLSISDRNDYFLRRNRQMIRERTLSGIRAAQAAGKVVGRPKRIFRRD